MKERFALLSLAASLTACAAPCAPQELGSGVLDTPGVVLGTVESVATVRIERDIHAFQPPDELRIQPERVDRIVIRLDDGRAITLVPNSMQRFEAGERVRILPDSHSRRVFHD